jgi:hypothetical protein
VQRALRDFGQKARGAIREAMNRTAEWADTDVRRKMREVFDRPTPYTLKSLRIYYANTANLKAVLWFKRRDSDDDAAWAVAQIEGGKRLHKRMEGRLRYAGILPNGWYAVPGSAAPLDAYGNMSRGEISRILNVLGTFWEAGYNKADYRTVRRLAKGTKKSYGFKYIVIHPGSKQGAHLLPGVYRRVTTPFGSSLKPMMIFVRDVGYRPRLPFKAVVDKTIAQRFPTEFDKALSSLIQTGSASSFRRTR